MILQLVEPGKAKGYGIHQAGVAVLVSGEDHEERFVVAKLLLSLSSGVRLDICGVSAGWSL